MWTGVPPAKSRPPILLLHPSSAQFQYANRSYLRKKKIPNKNAGWECWFFIGHTQTWSKETWKLSAEWKAHEVRPHHYRIKRSLVLWLPLGEIDLVQQLLPPPMPEWCPQSSRGKYNKESRGREGCNVYSHQWRREERICPGTQQMGTLGHSGPENNRKETTVDNHNYKYM